MSFSRAPLKRFNESVGCAPAPGSYEIKPGELKGAVSFEKSDRFRLIKAGAMPPPASPSRSALMSPVRRTMSVDGLMDGSSVKKERNGMTVERKQQKLLEREMRSLVQQRGEQDRRLQAVEEELKKVEAKLLSAVREKTGLSASVTTLERQRAELKKINEFLKNKVSADTTKNKIHSLSMELMEARNSLDVKNKEFSVLQITTEGQLKVLETDLQAAKTTVTALKDRNKDMEALHQVTKSLNEELENENGRLHAVVQELREEISVVQGYLDVANDQIQDLRLSLREKTQENTAAGSQVEKVNQLESELEQRTIELESTREDLEQKEEEARRFLTELQAFKSALVEVESRLESQELELQSSLQSVSEMEQQIHSANQEVEDSNTTVRQQEAELARLRDVLRRTEKELDERVAHWEQRCLFSEEERSKTQEQGLRRVQELKAELALLKEARKEETKTLTQLEQEHTALTEELDKEKALVDSLSVLVAQEREESSERLNHLQEEMEEVLGELAQLEEQEQGRREEIQGSQEASHRLQEDNTQLETCLSQARALLDSKSNDVVALKEEHSAAMRELQEAHANSLSKMADIVTELESARQAVQGAEGRHRELEAELERVRQRMKDETDREIQQKEEELQERQSAEAKAREEISRTLLEVQTELAHREEEMKAMEEKHQAHITSLQQEIQQHTAHTGAQEEKLQKALAEVSQEKELMMDQLQQERQGRLQTQVAVEAEKQECIRLQTEVLRGEEERNSLLSEMEVKEQSMLALQQQLSVAEEAKEKLECGLAEVEQGSRLQAETTQALQQQVALLTQDKVSLQWDMDQQTRELQGLITEAQEKGAQSSEMEQWRTQYEELFAKVRPFQEQLNAFAAERNALLNENGSNQEELNKLSDAYASLLGHHNQKQKIKHVMKLKDDNINLKQEVSKLRSQVSRQRSDLEQLKSELPGGRRSRFDSSKAFHHDKENRPSEAPEPLKEGNHKA